MKKFNYLAMSLLAIGATLSSCSNDDTVSKSDNELSGVDRAYLAVNIVTGQSTRAGSHTNNGTEEKFEDGTGNEGTVKTARFYFFDSTGNPYYVSGTKNYVEKDITLGNASDAHLEKETSRPVVIEVKSDLPKSVVTVLNPNETLGKENMSLSDFNGAKGLNAWNMTGENQFVMTTSVYADGSTPVYSTDITGKVYPYTVGNTAEVNQAKQNAEENPVDIYVERVLAKVVVTDKDGKAITNETTAFNTTIKDERNNTVSVGNIYAKIKGWALYNTVDKSYLVKKIDGTWTDSGLGFSWNESPKFRSYWAMTDDNVNFTKTVQYEAINIPENGALYPQENTNAGTHTGVIVAAQLQGKDGNPVEIAKYQGMQYYKAEDLKTAIAAKLANTLYTQNGDTYNSIGPDDITFDTPKDNTVKDYEVVAKAAEGVTLYKKTTGNNGENVYSTDGADAELAEQVARIYTQGMTYYFLPIRHLGYSSTAESQPTGAYGVVRNHVYKIQITGIAGLGTPVYKPNSETITPTTPTEENAYIAAKIHVQAWRVVNSDVTLK